MSSRFALAGFARSRLGALLKILFVFFALAPLNNNHPGLFTANLNI
jgi:hypothetical protein